MVRSEGVEPLVGALAGESLRDPREVLNLLRRRRLGKVVQEVGVSVLSLESCGRRQAESAPDIQRGGRRQRQKREEEQQREEELASDLEQRRSHVWRGDDLSGGGGKFGGEEG